MNDAILKAYGQAMQSAQRYESRMKLLLGLHNLVSGLSKSVTPLTDAEFEQLTALGDRTLGQALRGVLARLRGTPLPENADKVVFHTIEVRNFLAHHYFEEYSLLAEDESSWPYLVAELGHFSKLFDSLVPILDKNADMLLTDLGISGDDLKSAQECFNESALDHLRKDQLSALKENLEQIGIRAAPPPASTGPPDA